MTYRKRRLLHRRIFLGFSLNSHGHQELPHMTLNVFSGMHEQPQHRRWKLSTAYTSGIGQRPLIHSSKFS